MQVRYLAVVVVLALSVAVPGPAHAGFVNLGFEAGTAGWDLYDPPGGVAGNDILGNAAVYHPGITIAPYLPPEGDNYLRLHPDGPLLSEVAAQTATLGVGEVVSAVAAFDAQDYRRDAFYNVWDPTNPAFIEADFIYGDDAAFVEIYKGSWTAQQISQMTQAQRATNLFDIPWERRVWGPSGGAIPVTDYQNMGSPPMYGVQSDPWTRWQSQPIASAGEYTLSYRILSGLQPPDPPLGLYDPFLEQEVLKSYSLHDVPEASSCALWGLGVGLFAWMGYTRRKRA